jgi:hypothetical protein
MLKLHNALYQNICGGDLIFDLIWVERSVNIFKTKLVLITYYSFPNLGLKIFKDLSTQIKSISYRHRCLDTIYYVILTSYL